MSSVEFSVTATITEALTTLKSHKQQSNPSIKKVKDSGLFDEKLEKITLEQSQLVVKALKAINQSTNESTKQPITVHSLMKGSALLPPAEPPKKPRDPEFVAFLERMRNRADRREILMLSKPINSSVNQLNDSINESMNPERNNVANETRELGHGVNILTLMATGFAVFYYAGTMLFEHSKLGPILMGLVGLIGALFMEVTLLLIREGKRESFEAQKQDADPTIAKFNDPKVIHQSKLETHQYEQRRKEKEESMRKLMESMNQSSKQVFDPSTDPTAESKEKPIK